MRARCRRSLAFLALVLAAISTVHAKTPKTEPWIRVETDGVLVFSNAKQSRAVEVTRKLAQFRRVLDRLVNQSNKALPEARVFLLKNQTSYDRYGRSAGERAYYKTSRLGRFIVLNATRRGAGRKN